MRSVKIGKLQVAGQGSIKFSVSDHILIIRISYLKNEYELNGFFCAKLGSTVLKTKMWPFQI